MHDFDLPNPLTPEKQKTKKIGRNTKPLPPLTTLHIREQQFKPIAQRPHVRIHVLLQLKSLGHHFDRPLLHARLLARFEGEDEVAGVFWVDAEIVDGAFRVGFRIGG